MKDPFWLGLVSRLVPRSRRLEWRREWSAELAYYERLAASGDRSRLSRAIARRLYVIDAVEDAVGMWVRNPGSSNLMQELGWAGRALRRTPLFTVMAVVTLALGIGANVAMFSIVQSTLLRPLPYGSPDELVAVILSFRSERGERVFPASEPEYLELRDEGSAWSGLGAYWASSVNLGGGQEPLRVSVASVSANLLQVLDVQPALGRSFDPGEDSPGRDGVALLSHGLWVRAFGADPSVLGRDVVLDGVPSTVIGVLGPSFSFPGPAVDLLRPNTIDPADPAGRSSHYLTMVGRLAPGVSVEAAQARTDELVTRWNRAYPDRHGPNPGHPVTIRSLHQNMIADVRPALITLLGAVGLVLLIACANVASLVLVRTEQRQLETGVRVALGADRRQVAMPFLAESVILSLVGAVLGLGLALGAGELVEALGPELVRRSGGVRLDTGVLLFAAALAGGTTLLFGVGPALAAASNDAARTLGRGGVGGGPDGRRMPLRRALVVSEIAIAVVLVVASGLTLKSLARLLSVEPGFDPEGVVTMEFSLDAGRYPETGDVLAFHDALRDRLAAMAGVRAAGTIRALPFAHEPGMETITPVDRVLPEDEFWNARYQVASEGYFAALSVPLLTGRRFTTADRAGAPAVAIVSQGMADQYWGGEDPIGKRFKLGVRETPSPELTVVGVVGDVRGGFASRVEPTFYAPLGQAGDLYGGMGTRFGTLVARTDADPVVAMAAVRQAIREIDGTLPVANLRTMRGVLDRSVTDQRFLTAVIGAFSLLSLALGAVGIGGLMSYTVARRRAEFGVRIALGADGPSIVGLVLRKAVLLTTLGVAIGLAIAMAGSGLLATQLFDVGARDPAVLGGASLALFLVGVLAAYLPASRATLVDPVAALRDG